MSGIGVLEPCPQRNRLLTSQVATLLHQHDDATGRQRVNSSGVDRFSDFSTQASLTVDKEPRRVSFGGTTTSKSMDTEVATEYAKILALSCLRLLWRSTCSSCRLGRRLPASSVVGSLPHLCCFWLCPF